jgi:acyl-CoA synthetase (AMP-forming)/AMP-acid ligase II
MLLERMRREPSELALDDGVRRRSFGELEQRICRIARMLREDLGVAPDQHVALLMENRAEAIELLLGAICAGVWLTPINRHLVPEEVAYVARDSGARVLFADPEHEATARELAGPRVIVAGGDLERRIAAASAEPMPLSGPPGANMIYTSGTTGKPKGVKRARKRTLGEQLAFVGQQGAAVGLDGSGPHLVTGPLYHSAPLMFAVYDLLNGAPVIVMPRWDERESLRLIAERRIAHTHVVPTMLVRLLRLPDAERASADTSSLALVLHGAAPISRSVKQRVLDWWGDRLVEYWGGTESGVVTLVRGDEWRAHPGTVGRALPHYQVYAIDDAGKRLAPGETGELLCRHAREAQIFTYHADPEKTAASYPEPGAFTLGDIGWVDADGYVYLAERRSHTIISGGVNVYPAEIEAVLQEHPAVADVAVFGIPDDEWGESVKAAIELRPGHAPSDALAAELLAYARLHLAGYKIPRSIDFEAQLPRFPSGKLYLRRIRERYWVGRERRI